MVIAADKGLAGHRFAQEWASSARCWSGPTAVREQEPSFFTVIVWRDQAEHAAESLAKGSRVVVVGRLQQRSWTAEDGSARSVVEVVPRSWVSACGGRRRRRPERRGAPSTSAAPR
jgi:single-stranded DNA-binding protein